MNTCGDCRLQQQLLSWPAGTFSSRRRSTVSAAAGSVREVERCWSEMSSDVIGAPVPAPQGTKYKGSHLQSSYGEEFGPKVRRMPCTLHRQHLTSGPIRRCCN